MAFIQANLSTIIVAVIVFGILGFIGFRLVRNFRQGKSPCGCGCDKCRAARPPAGS
ncbi:MAG: FeoB-associated Cys-rich membrane protein [Treponema sp.]|jgi:nucleoside-diphosphate-sugar epimerase|nr:FeoB-associated Cys-rich membrane protein [Treponema sp.]